MCYRMLKEASEIRAAPEWEGSAGCLKQWVGDNRESARFFWMKKKMLADCLKRNEKVEMKDHVAISIIKMRAE